MDWSRWAREWSWFGRYSLLLAGRYLLALGVIYILAKGLPGTYVDYLRFHGAVLEERTEAFHVISLRRLLQLDLGDSFVTGKPVIDLLRYHIPATIELSALAFALAVGVSLVVGLLVWRLNLLGNVITNIATLAVGIPSFVTASLIILIVAPLGTLPLGGRTSVGISYEPATGFLLLDSALNRNWPLFWDGLSHLVLPGLAVALAPSLFLSAIAIQQIRSIAQSDFIRTATAKGLPWQRVFFLHLLRNVVASLTPLLGLLMASILGGSIVIESTLDFPGVGAALSLAVQYRDTPVILGLVLVTGTFYFLAFSMADITQRLLDPRIRGEE